MKIAKNVNKKEHETKRKLNTTDTTKSIYLDRLCECEECNSIVLLLLSSMLILKSFHTYYFYQKKKINKWVYKSNTDRVKTFKIDLDLIDIDIGGGKLKVRNVWLFERTELYRLWAFCDWPVWIRLWIFNVDLCENRFIQRSHSNGRSPVWVRWCISRYGLRQKAAGHKSQRNGRFPTALIVNHFILCVCYAPMVIMMMMVKWNFIAFYSTFIFFQFIFCFNSKQMMTFWKKNSFV